MALLSTNGTAEQCSSLQPAARHLFAAALLVLLTTPTHLMLSLLPRLLLCREGQCLAGQGGALQFDCSHPHTAAWVEGSTGGSSSIQVRYTASGIVQLPMCGCPATSCRATRLL
jgi:hypothetical protein